MDDLSRSEYPALLANLQPRQAVDLVNERLRRIATINSEIATWLQERQKVEEQYVAGLRRLVQFKVPNSASELGIFQSPWDRVLHSTDSIAASHQLLAQRISKDGEAALRNFQGRKDWQSMQTVAGNLTSIAKELDEAKSQSDKVSKKAGKASAAKVDTTAAHLESASSQWESQAPFIMETLQAIDEKRCNHLRDVLTQLQTHEVDNSDRLRQSANEALASIIELNTTSEIQNFARRSVAGKPRLETWRSSTAAPTVPPSRQASNVPEVAPPRTASSQPEDDLSEQSAPVEKSENKLRSRIGTMLGRRRQSAHGGFGQLASSKTGGAFGRGSSGRGLSPRTSASNLGGSSTRLDSLAEAPDSPVTNKKSGLSESARSNGTNAVPPSLAPRASSNTVNGTISQDVLDAPPPPGPPPSHIAANKAAAAAKDEEGYSIPAPANDPISQAQKDAAAEADSGPDGAFKLNIQHSPIAEEDPEASKAAISNVANTLSTMSAPSRRTGTVRGRRDVRNTMYMPTSAPLAEMSSLAVVGETTERMPPSPAAPSAVEGTTTGRPPIAAQHSLPNEGSVAGTSDTQSIRSAGSVGGFVHGQHQDASESGLNSSIVESVSATFEDGKITSVKVAGEIAFANNAENSASHGTEVIRINDFANLEAIGPNRIFVSSTASPDEFRLDLSHIPAKTPTPGFTYRVHSDSATSDHLSSLCPLIIKPAWKPTGDKLGLLLQYRANPSAKLSKSGTIQLKNLVIMATYENARASGVQTKPSGTHLKDKHLVYWRLGDVTLNADAAKLDDWQKIVCRIIGAENGEPKPGTIEARWEIVTPAASGVSGDAIVGGASGISISRRVEDKGKGKAVVDDDGDEDDDPFADDGEKTPRETPKTEGHSWVSVPLARKLVSGHYEAK